MALQEVLAFFGVDMDKKSFDGAEKKIDAMKNSLGGMVTAVAGAFAAGKMFGFVEDLVTVGDNLGDLVSRTGATAREIQAFAFVGEDAGASAEALGAGLEKLQKGLGKAGGKAGPAAQELKRLGIDAKNSDGSFRSMTDLLPDIADSLSGMEDDTKRAGAAVALFGNGGLELLPVLKKSRAEIMGLLTEFDELGGGFSDDFISAASKADDQTRRLNARLTLFKSKIGEAILPIINKMGDFLLKAAARFAQLAKGTDIFKASLIAFGAVAVAVGAATFSAWAPFVGGILVASAAIAILAIGMEDLMGFFDGRESLIGELLGPDAQKDLIAFKNMAVGIFTTLKGVFMGAVDGLIAAWPMIVAGFVAVKDSVKRVSDNLSFLWPILKVGLAAFWVGIKAIGATLYNLFETLSPLLIPIIEALLTIATTAFTLIGIIFTGAAFVLEKISALIRAVLRPIAKLIGGAIELGFTNRTLESFRNGAPDQPPAVKPSTGAVAFGSGGNTALTMMGGPTTIKIDGSKDPVQTGSAVATAIDKRRTGELVAAREALVPVLKGK